MASHGNQFCGKIVEKLTTPALIALSFRNKMGYRYFNERINSANAASILCENFVKFGPVGFELKWGRKWKLCCDSSEISRFSFIWHTGVLKRIRKSQFWFQQVNWQSLLYIWWKLGEIRISDPRLLAEKVVRPESIIVTTLRSPMFAMGWGC